MKRFFSSNAFFLILLIAISAYTWRFIPQQVIRGDGFVYLISKTQHDFFSRDFFYTGFELSAASFGWLFSRLYSINISWYWWTAYIVMLVTHVFFYWLAITIFKKPLLAFVASVFFALNYFGAWDIYSSHCYCFFLERIIPALFLLPAAVYLHRFLEKRKKRDGIVSLILYFLGIGVGHWSVFVTALFFFYPVSCALFPIRGKGKSKDALIGGLYVGITVFFILIQRVHESGFHIASPVDFFFHPEVSLWPQKVIRQFVHWTQYPVFVQGDLYTSLFSKISDDKSIVAITPYIFSLYGFIFLVMYAYLPQKRALLLTTLLGTASIFFVNALFGQYDVMYQPGSNRYLYYPTMLLSLFWTLFIAFLIKKQHIVFTGIAVVLVSGFMVTNISLIRESYTDSLGYNRSTKAVYDYIQIKSSILPRDTLVVGPYDEIGVYEAVFFTEQLTQEGIKVMSAYNTYAETNMWERTASTSANVVRLFYRRSCNCIGEEWLKREE